MIQQTRPSAAFVLQLFERNGLKPHSGFAAILTQLDWESFSAAVEALGATLAFSCGTPRDLSRVLIGHSRTEAAGAEVIAHVAAVTPDEGHSKALRRHAADERRHSRIFSALSAIAAALPAGAMAAPEAARDSFVDEYDGDLAGFLCDTHFAEIRNVFHIGALVRMAAHPDPSAARKIRAGLARVILDERRHVTGTARMLGQLFDADPFLPDRIRVAFAEYVKFIGREAQAAREAASRP